MGKLGKEMIERRDKYVSWVSHCAIIADSSHDKQSSNSRSHESSARHLFTTILSPRIVLYNLRLYYPFSLERSALLAQCEDEEHRGLECMDVAYDEEKLRVEEECRTGWMRVRERLLEGLEERRKKAKE